MNLRKVFKSGSKSWVFYCEDEEPLIEAFAALLDEFSDEIIEHEGAALGTWARRFIGVLRGEG